MSPTTCRTCTGSKTELVGAKSFLQYATVSSRNEPPAGESDVSVSRLKLRDGPATWSAIQQLADSGLLTLNTRATRHLAGDPPPEPAKPALTEEQKLSAASSSNWFCILWIWSGFIIRGSRGGAETRRGLVEPEKSHTGALRPGEGDG